MKYYIGPWIKNDLNIWTAPAGTVGLLDLRSNAQQAQGNYGLFAVPDDITLSGDYRQFGGTGYITDLIPAESDRSVFASMASVATVSGASLMDWVWDVYTTRADPNGVNAVRPLIPTTAGNLDIHLGGHSLVRRKKFDLNIPEAAPVIAVLKEQYRQLRKDAKDGKLNGDPEFHRRVLDYWGKKYRVNNPEDVFVPSGMPKEKRLAHQTSIADTFDRANSASLGTSSDGDWSWTQFDVGSENMQILNNKLAGRQDWDQATINHLFVRADKNLSSDDHEVEATLTAANVFAGSVQVSAVARMNSTTTIDGYDAGVYSADGVNYDLILTKTVADARTSLGGPTSTDNTHPAALKVSADGSTIKSYYKGVEVHSPTDSSVPPGNLRTGVFAFQIGGAWEADSFSAADLAPGGGDVDKARAHYYHMLLQKR